MSKNSRMFNDKVCFCVKSSRMLAVTVRGCDEKSSRLFTISGCYLEC